jgi:hypothetical protein
MRKPVLVYPFFSRCKPLRKPDGFMYKCDQFVREEGLPGNKHTVGVTESGTSSYSNWRLQGLEIKSLEI